MHSAKRDPINLWKKSVAAGGLALAALAFGGAAEAHDRHDRGHDHRYERDHRHGHHGKRARVRDAREIDRRLDRRGDAIDLQLDLLAFVAAANGDWALAEHLDRKGDRIERRLDRKGDRLLRDARARHRGWDRHHRGHGYLGKKKWKHARRHDRIQRERAFERGRAFERDRQRERRFERKIDREERRERQRDRERMRRRNLQRDDDRVDRRDRRDRRGGHVDALGRHARDRRF